MLTPLDFSHDKAILLSATISELFSIPTLSRAVRPSVGVPQNAKHFADQKVRRPPCLYCMPGTVLFLRSGWNKF